MHGPVMRTEIYLGKTLKMHGKFKEFRVIEVKETAIKSLISIQFRNIVVTYRNK